MQHALNKCLKYRFEFLYAFLTILIAFSPYIRQDLIVGSDYPFHLARIETLAQNLSYGLFPNKVHVDLCYGYGYGVGFFYPDFFLYIPAIFMLLGFSLEVAFKLFAGILLSAIFLSMFYCVYRLTYDRYAALAAAAVFLFSNQVLGSFYYSFTLGTSTALIFIPLAICGMYLFLARDENPWMLGLGFTGLLYSHVLSTFLAVIICSILLLIYFKKLFRTPKKIGLLLVTVLSVSALTASFWLPMLEQLFAQTFRLSEPWTWVDDNVLLLSRLIHSEGFGWTLTILVLLSGFHVICPSTPDSSAHLSDQQTASKKGLRLFYCFGLILYLLPVCSKFWQIFRSMFKFLQFPNRLLVPAAVLMIFAAGILFSSTITSKHQKRIVAMLLLAAALYTGINYIGDSFEMTEDFGGRILYHEIAGLGAGEEYLPIETTRDDLTTPNLAFSELGGAISGTRINEVFLFPASPESDYYDVPFVWYKGYRACTDSGMQLETVKNPENGLVRVLTDSLEQPTTISVYYSGTTLTKLSCIISIISFLFLFTSGILRFLKYTGKHHRH
ncbi:MAG TPA: hypothetical protein H9744_01360 [Candidatus Eisenbergiella stercoravium]|nr:hypothetical protein [Candidatus Eisenbergiella stercoravium]